MNMTGKAEMPDAFVPLCQIKRVQAGRRQAGILFGTDYASLQSRENITKNIIKLPI